MGDFSQFDRLGDSISLTGRLAGVVISALVAFAAFFEIYEAAQGVVRLAGPRVPQVRKGPVPRNRSSWTS